MDKPTCLCGETMDFVMDNKRAELWECQNCYRLLVRRKESGHQSWYVPEAELKEPYKPKERR